MIVSLHSIHKVMQTNARPSRNVTPLCFGVLGFLDFMEIICFPFFLLVGVAGGGDGGSGTEIVHFLMNKCEGNILSDGDGGGGSGCGDGDKLGSHLSYWTL